MTVHHNSHETKTVVFKLVGEAEGYRCAFFFFPPQIPEIPRTSKVH